MGHFWRKDQKEEIIKVVQQGFRPLLYLLFVFHPITRHEE